MPYLLLLHNNRALFRQNDKWLGLQLAETGDVFVLAMQRAKSLKLTLRTREAIGGPAEGMAICAQEGILLLHSKPRVVIFHHAHNLLTAVTQVGFCWNNRVDKLKVKNAPPKSQTTLSFEIAYLQVCGCI